MKRKQKKIEFGIIHITIIPKEIKFRKNIIKQWKDIRNLFFSKGFFICAD